MVITLLIGFSCTGKKTVETKRKTTSIEQLNLQDIKNDSMIITTQGDKIISPNLVDDILGIPIKNTEGDSTVFIFVDNMPEFPGGMVALIKYIRKNIKYPKEVVEQAIAGTVHLEFIIDQEGHITNAKVIRSIDPLLDAEALRVVRSMPKWIPGRQKGKAVKVIYKIPINFSLS